VLEASLAYQDECPGCGRNWKQLEDALYESMQSPDWFWAMKAIENCSVCRKRFKGKVTFVNNKGGEDDLLRSN